MHTLVALLLTHHHLKPSPFSLAPGKKKHSWKRCPIVRKYTGRIVMKHGHNSLFQRNRWKLYSLMVNMGAAVRISNGCLAFFVSLSQKHLNSNNIWTERNFWLGYQISRHDGSRSTCYGFCYSYQFLSRHIQWFGPSRGN